MLNYTRKNINVIALIITAILCGILIIVLDMYFLNSANTKNMSNRPIYTESIEIGDNNKINRQRKDAMKVEDTFQELMQIADIYDDDTLIEEIEDNSQNSEVSEEENTTDEVTDSETNEDIPENTTTYVEEILDKDNEWRIKIPKINVNAPIRTGYSQDILALAVGHFPETTSWNGNVALAGHNRGYRCNFFQNIKELNVGDKIIYTTENGERTYKVVLNKIIKQTDWSYVQETEDNRITLITCVENMHDYRRCVQAVEVI